ncbi:MAG TPA: beta-glucosidase, partial [Planctomycetes bacterium]|nr:beta-glucosidase [Planctomycetota bacterium]
LVRWIGAVTAREARALGYTNVYAPILDMARDPRWGRVEENYGESPYHSSRLGVAMVKGLQENGVVSTPKHYCVYGIPEGGRDGRARTAPHATPREVFEVYLAPFRAAFTEGGALGTMVSYNDYDGMPVEASTFFLVDLLRQRWGFRGYTVSDSDAVRFIWSKHHVAADYKDAVRLSILGGLNVRTTFTKPEDYILPARELVREGKIPMKVVDERVRDVLRVKYWLGLFDHPYVAHPEKSDQVLHCEAHRKLAYRAALESMVLLKNQGGLLPLKKDLKTILVAGPNADAKSRVLGGYGPKDAKMISVLQGIREKVSKGTEVIYVKGCDIKDKRYPLSEILPEPPKGKDAARIEEARKAAEKADVAILVLGENTSLVGESRSRTSLDLTGYQRELAKAVVSTGTPTVVVLLNGRALTINWIARHVPAILEAWFPGEEGGRAVADVLFGDYNPGGRLAVTFPKTVGQIPYCFPHKPASHSPGRNRVSGALFPFGHGLSYTTFKYSNLRVDPKVQGVGGNIHVSVDVKNTGSRKGDEVVQLYLSDLQASVVPYVKVLRGFRRITLDPGRTKTVRFTLTPDDLRIMGPHMEWIVEPGDFRVQVGPLKAEFTIAP